MKQWKVPCAAALCALLLGCGCAQPALEETPAPVQTETPAPTPEPTPVPTPAPLLPAVEYDLYDGDRIEDDFDGDGVMDSISLSGVTEVTFTVEAAGCAAFTCTMPSCFSAGHVLGLDFGDSAYTWIFSTPTGFNGGAGALYTAAYRLKDGAYECFLDELPAQEFTGSVGADGASVTIEGVSGLVQEGTLVEGASEIIANTALATDPVCRVSWVHEEDAGRYDIVVDQYVYSDVMHIAGVAMCHTQYCFADGEFALVRQWADVW